MKKFLSNAILTVICLFSLNLLFISCESFLEGSPFMAQLEKDIEYAKEKGIKLMTYSPLMDVAKGRIKEEYFKDIMQKYNKSLAQILLRWNVERGSTPLAKSGNVNRQKENLDIADFHLTKEEVAYISMLNRNYQYLAESRICPGI